MSTTVGARYLVGGGGGEGWGGVGGLSGLVSVDPYVQGP